MKYEQTAEFQATARTIKERINRINQMMEQLRQLQDVDVEIVELHND